MQNQSSTGFLGSVRRVLRLLSDLIVNSVNPRFRVFTYAFTLAVVVGLTTVAVLAVITWKLMSSCTSVCSPKPIGVLNSELNGQSTTNLFSFATSTRSSNLTCYSYATQALTLDITAPQILSKVGNNGQSHPFDQAWDQFQWQAETSYMSMCSFLHYTEWGRRSWVGLWQGLLAMYQRANGTTESWPTTTVTDSNGTQSFLYSSAYNGLKTLVYMDNTTSFNAAGAASILAALKASTTCQSLWASGATCTLLTAPAEAECCNISTDMGLFGGDILSGGSRYTLTASSRGPVTGSKWSSFSSERCSSASGYDNYGTVKVSVAFTVPYQQNLVSFLCKPGAPSSTTMGSVSFAAKACQVMNVTNGKTQVCVNGTSSFQFDFANFYDFTGSCGNGNANNITLRATSKPAAAQQLAAATVLLPFLYDMSRMMGFYMAQAISPVDDDKPEPFNLKDLTYMDGTPMRAFEGMNMASAWWMQQYVYCCKCTYADMLSSLGSALGYEGYVEAAIALLVLFSYLGCYRGDRERLHLNIQSITNLAMESEPKDKDKASVGAKSLQVHDAAAATAEVKISRPTSKAAVHPLPDEEEEVMTLDPSSEYGSARSSAMLRARPQRPSQTD